MNPFDEDIEAWLDVWKDEYQKGEAYPGDLTRHPVLAAMTSDGSVFNPLAWFWPGTAMENYATAVRLTLPTQRGHAGILSGLIVYHVISDTGPLNDKALGYIRALGKTPDDDAKRWWPRPSELPRFVATRYEWEVLGGCPICPPQYITPARTFPIQSPHTGRTWVLCGHRGNDIVGVEIPDPSTVSRYRRFPVFEWKKVLPW